MSLIGHEQSIIYRHRSRRNSGSDSYFHFPVFFVIFSHEVTVSILPMSQILIACFALHDWASAFLAKHLFGIKRAILVVAHLALFGFFFPDLRKGFGQMAEIVLYGILFLSPLSKMLRMRLLLQLMSLRREFGIAMAYLATVHGLGYLLDPQWFDLLIAPSLQMGFLHIDPPLLFGLTAYVLTLPLLLTSNALAQRLLGKKWKMLHRLVYGLFVLVLLHRFTIQRGVNAFGLIQAFSVIGLYVLAKVLAWKNFIRPLQEGIDWVALRYREYSVAQKERGLV